MRRPASNLARCRRGATVVEFALLAPVFLLLLFGIIEVARLAWTRQTLEETAFATARCMSVGSSCATATAQKSFAVQRAAAYRIAITAAAVTPTAATSCAGQTNSNLVTIAAPFVSALRGLVPLPRTLQVTACFPVLP
ncbi:MAG: TadE/TadG family type IV pilus assembly protein [Novosphingobium sp.]